eukprot:15476323-Alexandrium_andersonii.AAC.1
MCLLGSPESAPSASSKASLYSFFWASEAALMSIPFCSFSLRAARVLDRRVPPTVDQQEVYFREALDTGGWTVVYPRSSVGQPPTTLGD